MTINHLVRKAIDYANDPDHCGAGYTLLIRERSGDLVQVSVWRNYHLTVENPDHKPDLLPHGSPYFPGDVSSVTVLW